MNEPIQVALLSLCFLFGAIFSTIMMLRTQYPKYPKKWTKVWNRIWTILAVITITVTITLIQKLKEMV